MRAVRLGDSVSLLCGTNIVSNPAAIVTWLDPLGRDIAQDPRFRALSSESSVALEITSATRADEGEWTCVLRVEGTNLRRLEGGVDPNITIIGEERLSINLTVVGKLYEAVCMNVACDSLHRVAAHDVICHVEVH